MSTFGRELDALAARQREIEQRIAEKATQLQDAVAFAILTLSDPELSSIQARKVALEALRAVEKVAADA